MVNHWPPCIFIQKVLYLLSFHTKVLHKKFYSKVMCKLSHNSFLIMFFMNLNCHCFLVLNNYSDLWVSISQKASIINISGSDKNFFIINYHQFTVNINHFCGWSSFNDTVVPQCEELDVIANILNKLQLLHNWATSSADCVVNVMQLDSHHSRDFIIYFTIETRKRRNDHHHLELTFLFVSATDSFD